MSRGLLAADTRAMQKKVVKKIEAMLSIVSDLILIYLCLSPGRHQIADQPWSGVELGGLIKTGVRAGGLGDSIEDHLLAHHFN